MAANGNPSVDLIPAGQIVRQEFGAQQIQNTGETASAAVAAREQAAVQARYSMALMRRRDTDQFRIDLLKECKRPGFAEMAEYHRPVGNEYNRETRQWEQKIATGPSIHLIRTAVALYGNMLVDSATMFDSREIRLVHAYVLDLERNVSWARTVAIPKQVEKRGTKEKNGTFTPPKDRDIISERRNSYDEPVYTVLATEDEIRTKEARLLAIAQRENGRSVLPRDILDEAIRVARTTIATEDAKDPDAARRKIIDGFAEFGVKPEALTEYLSHGLDTLTPKEIKELRGVFVSLREGESTWEEIMLVKNPTGSKEAAAKVAADKLANLGVGKEIPKPHDNGGARTTEPIAADSASGKTDSPAGDRNDREIPPSTGPGHQAAIAQYQSVIGDAAFFRILGANSYESADQVEEKHWRAIAKEMDQEVENQRASKPQESKGKFKLK